MKKLTSFILIFCCSAAFLLSATPAFALWSRVRGYDPGSIDGDVSPTTPVAYEFVATETNTIDPLSFPNGGGCITMLYLDFLAPTPDSITTTMKNAIGLAIDGPSTSALTADGWLYQPDTGSPICIGKGFSFTFTGTIAIGDKFRLIFEAMTK